MNELLDKIIDFCSENYTLIAGAGGILLALIVAGIFISNRSRAARSDEPRDFFLEGEYDEIIRDVARERKKAGTPAEEAVSEEAPAEEAPPAEAVPEAAVAAAELMEAEPVAKEAEAETVPEELALEDLITEEEYQPVHININIERGQVKIGYDEDGRITCMVESDEDEAQPEDVEEPPVPTPAQGGIVLEKINLIKAAPARRFGPENFNTGRSGRIFTEEELQEQIKD